MREPAMTRKSPSLTIVGPDATGISPPRKLGRHGAALWNRVQGEYAIQDIGGIEVLCQICQALDDVESLTEAVERDGRTIRSRTGIKANPALRDILQNRAFIVRSLSKLGITTEPIKPIGRPGSGVGISWEQLDRGDE
jgi:Phage terminase, small subunit